MNILHVNSNIASRSGVMRVLMNYHHALQSCEGVRFDYAYYRPTQDSFEAEISELGGCTHSISSPKHPFRFMRDLGCLLDGSGKQYDVVHLHDPSLVRLVSPVVRKSNRCKLVVHSHATAYSDKRLSAVRNHLLCLNINKQADALFACSEAAGKFLFGNASFHVVRNAIDTSAFAFSEEERRAVREALSLSDDCLVLGHVGSFVGQKNHHFLIDTFSQIRKKEPSSKLLLIGDGPLVEPVHDQVITLGLEDDVVFLGPRNDVHSLYQAMDVFVLPSLYEGLPMVGVEAQCSGLPAVFSNEITQEVGVEGSLFLGLDKSASQWAREIIKTGRNASDIRAGGMARVSDKGFDVVRETRSLLNAYRELLST